MSKPQSKAESRWQAELAELRFVCHSAAFRKYVKQQRSKAARRAEKGWCKAQ